jgi:hypothetical protein
MAVTISYGAVNLQLCSFEQISRTPIYDGPTFKFYSCTFAIAGTLSPAATSYVSGPAGPTATPGFLGAQTDVAIRQYIMQPRRLLVVDIGGVEIMRSPATDPVTGSPLATDAYNGPVPRNVNVQEVLGSKTFLVSFVVEVFLNECNADQPNVVLSHRWTMEDIVEMPHYLTTRIISGWATLRTDWMIAAGFAPDDFRAAFFHPVLPVMQRQRATISVSEDGASLQYTLVDQERTYNIGILQNVTDIKASHNAQVGKLSVDEVIIPVGRIASRTIGRAGGALAQGGLNFISGGAGALGHLGAGALDVGLTVMQLMPRQMDNITVQVWGNANSSRNVLNNIALQVAFGRLAQTANGAQIAGVVVAGLHLSITHNLMEKYVEVTLRARQGLGNQLLTSVNLTTQFFAGLATNPPGGVQATINRTIAAIVNVGASGNLNGNINQAIMPPETPLANYAGVAAASQQVPNNGNPAPPGYSNILGRPQGSLSNSRGTMIYKLLAQTLPAPCALPAAPPEGSTIAGAASMVATNKSMVQ